MDLNTVFNVTNRSGGYVFYSIPEDRINREFNPRETKRITLDELSKVAQQPGGRELIYNYLLIDDPEGLHETINMQEEREYWLTEAEIPKWINACSLDEFKDALQFAPNGVKDIIKQVAVDLPLNDNAKREAIKSMLGYDVSAAIEIKRQAEEDEEPTAVTTGRRTTASSIKVPAPKKAAESK